MVGHGMRMLKSMGELGEPAMNIYTLLVPSLGPIVSIFLQILRPNRR